MRCATEKVPNFSAEKKTITMQRHLQIASVNYSYFVRVHCGGDKLRSTGRKLRRLDHGIHFVKTSGGGRTVGMCTLLGFALFFKI